MERIFPSSEHTNRSLWNAYMPHALLLIERAYPQYSTKGHGLLYRVSLCLLADGQTRKALGWLMQRNNRANGQIGEAVELLKHVVAVQAALAEDHPDRLVSEHVLAIAYQANSQIGEAIKLLEHVVTVRETALAEDHPDRLASQQVLEVVQREYEEGLCHK
ncbi:Acyl transferase/acyl hydrolase/lysophospholipase [Penicillium crustosum]|uniref:Acyl transferase/acyl hydrolase/lysophospholipase n=1 Tax=Penicillium crustosum TaxID=36656 RepID=UPI0023932A8E|nr:Acyl transferase/acyl hydrolase/lysophospholipase [Penicillium crustosum]KAJ5402753.1 Acyl transferase/acyl hydrolase/lysophospholipase [Penicillium crustosum]